MVNCAIPGCFVSKTPKYVGKSLFKITQRQNEFYSEWRKKVVDIVSKYRDMTPTFKKEVLDCTRELHICEDHYKTEDITLTSTNKKVLCDMALPTQKLPEKSFTTVQVQRKLPAVRPFVEVDDPLISRSVSHSASEYYYKDLDELYSDFHQNRK